MIERLKIWLELKTDRRAMTALEYALIAGVLVLVVFAVSTILGNGVDTSFNDLARVL